MQITATGNIFKTILPAKNLKKSNENKLNTAILRPQSADSFIKTTSVSFGGRLLSDELLKDTIDRLLKLDIELSTEFYQLHSGPNKINPGQMKTIQETVSNQFLEDFNNKVEDKEYKRAQILVNIGGPVTVMANKILNNKALLQDNSISQPQKDKIVKELNYYQKGLDVILAKENPKYKIAELQCCIAAKNILNQPSTDKNNKLQIIAFDMLKPYCSHHIVRFFLIDDFILSENKSVAMKKIAIESLPEIANNLNLRNSIKEEIVDVLTEFVKTCPEELKQTCEMSIKALNSLLD